MTNWINKHVVLVGEKPMIYYPLLALERWGVKKVIVVLGEPFGNQVKEVVQELKFDLKINYVWQKKARGLPDAIYQTKEITDGESILVVAGDNIFGASFGVEIDNFAGGEWSYLKKVNDGYSHAVAEFKDENIKIVEKPKGVKKAWAVIGPHIFDKNVFGIIENLRPSERNELELVDIHREYEKRGQLKLIKTAGFWADVGTPKRLAKVSRGIIANRIKIEG